jgi:hypothetical protein
MKYKGFSWKSGAEAKDLLRLGSTKEVSSAAWRTVLSSNTCSHGGGGGPTHVKSCGTNFFAGTRTAVFIHSTEAQAECQIRECSHGHNLH